MLAHRFECLREGEQKSLGGIILDQHDVRQALVAARGKLRLQFLLQRILAEIGNHQAHVGMFGLIARHGPLHRVTVEIRIPAPDREHGLGRCRSGSKAQGAGGEHGAKAAGRFQ